MTLRQLRRKAVGLVFGLALPVLAAGAAMAESPIEGTWVTALRSEITILPCPEGFCGFITKVVVPEHILKANEGAGIDQMDEEDFFDANNKDPALRTRPIMGLQILTLRAAQKPLVYDGEIYNPEDGNTYSGYMEVLSTDAVRLNGCVLFNVLCRGEDWVRADPDAASN